jgi:hypothetical protein
MGLLREARVMGRVAVPLTTKALAGRIAAAALVCVSLAAQGCGTAFPPAPPRATSFPPTAAAQPSVVEISMAVRLRGVQQALNRSGSATVLNSGWRAVQASSSDGFADGRKIIAQYLNAKVVGSGFVPTEFRLTARRDPVAVGAQGQGGTLRLGFNDRYELEVRSRAGSYVCSPRNSSALRTAADVTAVVRPDGTLQEKVSQTSQRLTAVCSAASSLLRDREIDLTPVLRAAYARALFKLTDTLTILLQRATDLVLRVKFATLATTFAQPTQISANAWLTPNLQNAAVRRLLFAARGSDLFANFGLALAAHPQISLGSEPPTASPVWPPRFANLEEPDGFHLAVDVRVPFDLITQRARAQLQGTELPVKFIGTIRVDDVDVYATDAGTPEAPHPQLVVQIDFSGAASGKLYLWGTPTIDPATRVISMPDLNYTTDTRRLLVRFFAPVIMSNFVVSRVRNATTFDASTLIDERTAPFLKPYDRTVQLPDGTSATLHAVPSPVGLNGISVAADALIVQAVVNGTVDVNVDTDVNALSLLTRGH